MKSLADNQIKPAAPCGNKENEMNIQQLREAAKKANKKLVFNRGKGGYQIAGHGFDFSEIAWRDEKGRLGLEQRQINNLFSCI
jgi:hypothetical protein